MTFRPQYKPEDIDPLLLQEMIEKVISGGQTGADQAGLRAAKASGLVTGGWLPQGCITLEGPRPDLLEVYSMQEHHRKGYPARTEANVRDSDGTIRFAEKFGTAGERCTLKAIHWFKKPYLDIPVITISVEGVKPHPVIGFDVNKALAWLEKNDIKTLNVAGNSEETCEGIGDVVYDFLVQVFGVTHD